MRSTDGFRHDERTSRLIVTILCKGADGPICGAALPGVSGDDVANVLRHGVRLFGRLDWLASRLATPKDDPQNRARP